MICCVSEQYDRVEAYIRVKEEDPEQSPGEHQMRFEHEMRNISPN